MASVRACVVAWHALNNTAGSSMEALCTGAQTSKSLDTNFLHVLIGSINLQFTLRLLYGQFRASRGTRKPRNHKIVVRVPSAAKIVKESVPENEAAEMLPVVAAYAMSVPRSTERARRTMAKGGERESKGQQGTARDSKRARDQ
eukprot:1600748-Rhodomonas_salina.1